MIRYFSRYPFFVLLFSLSAFIGHSQHFTQLATSVGVDFTTTHNNWGCGLSFYDWNKDGWPDLSFSRFGAPPRFFQNNEGIFEEVDFGIPNTHEGKMIMWVDYDNDGDADLFITRRVGPWSLYQNDGNFNFTDVTESVGIFQVDSPFAYGASWGDINNDGWLDLYISCYNTWVNQPETTITNYLFQSNGDGTFTEVGTTLGVDNGSKHTFQTTFVDINRDGWQDLYVANDRLPDSNDLYLNNGDGTFTNITDGSGADVYINTMSNTVGDYDNDGDLDFYIANSQAGNAHLRNNGDNTFTDVANEVGTAVNQFCWSGMWFDYDLDGWKDLLVLTGLLNNQPTQNYMYTNNGDGNYTYTFLSGFQGHLNVAHSMAVADYNNDGMPDVAISVRAPLKAELWHNNMPVKNYLKVHLEGVISNRDGIGSFIDCYSGGIAQTHYTLCGESFMGQNSQYYHFGLSDWENVDSLKITWLSGIVDTYYNIDPNQTLYLVEGETLPGPVLSEQGGITLCVGDTLILSVANDIFANYLWSTGDSDASIVVMEDGDFWVEATNEFGMSFTSVTVSVTFTAPPSIELISSPFVCHNDSTGFILIESPNAGEAVLMLNGIEGPGEWSDLAAGTYIVSAGSLGCMNELTVQIEGGNEISAVLEIQDVSCYGFDDGTIDIVGVSGAVGEVLILPDSLNLSALASGQYSITIMDEEGCSYTFVAEVFQPDSLWLNAEINASNESMPSGTGSIEIFGGTPPYEIEWMTGDSGLSVEELPVGPGWVEVVDSNGCVILVDFNVPVGLYELGIDCDIVLRDGLVSSNCPGLIGMEMRDVLGRIIVPLDAEIRLTNQHYPGGIYIIAARFNGGATQFMKIVIE